MLMEHSYRTTSSVRLICVDKFAYNFSEVIICLERETYEEIFVYACNKYRLILRHGIGNVSGSGGSVTQTATISCRSVSHEKRKRQRK